MPRQLTCRAARSMHRARAQRADFVLVRSRVFVPVWMLRLESREDLRLQVRRHVLVV